jgi:hypothetical protein
VLAHEIIDKIESSDIKNSDEYQIVASFEDYLILHSNEIETALTFKNNGDETRIFLEPVGDGRYSLTCDHEKGSESLVMGKDGVSHRYIKDCDIEPPHGLYRPFSVHIEEVIFENMLHNPSGAAVRIIEKADGAVIQRFDKYFFHGREVSQEFIDKRKIHTPSMLNLIADPSSNAFELIDEPEVLSKEFSIQTSKMVTEIEDYLQNDLPSLYRMQDELKNEAAILETFLNLKDGGELNPSLLEMSTGESITIPKSLFTTPVVELRSMLAQKRRLYRNVRFRSKDQDVLHNETEAAVIISMGRMEINIYFKNGMVDSDREYNIEVFKSDTDQPFYMKASSTLINTISHNHSTLEVKPDHYIFTTSSDDGLKHIEIGNDKGLSSLEQPAYISISPDNQVKYAYYLDGEQLTAESHLEKRINHSLSLLNSKESFGPEIGELIRNMIPDSVIQTIPQMINLPEVQPHQESRDLEI